MRRRRGRPARRSLRAAALARPVRLRCGRRHAHLRRSARRRRGLHLHGRGRLPDGVTPVVLSDNAFRIGDDDIWRHTGTLPGVEGVDGGDYVPPLLCSYSGEIDVIGGQTGVEGVYTFTAPEAGLYRFSTERSADLPAGILDTVLSLRGHCDAAADVLACDDDGSGVLLLSTLYERLALGQTVTVVVEAWDSSENAADFVVEAARVALLATGARAEPTPSRRATRRTTSSAWTVRARR